PRRVRPRHRVSARAQAHAGPGRRQAGDRAVSARANRRGLRPRRRRARRQDRAHAVRRLARATALGALGALAALPRAVGCRTASARFLDAAAARGLSAEVVAGNGFSHLVLSSPRRSGPVLHVYLDGDGTPSLAGYPAVDPTPREPLVLDLLALDGGPAVYLGR